MRQRSRNSRAMTSSLSASLLLFLLGFVCAPACSGPDDETPEGACCMRTGGCVTLDEANCEIGGGYYQGDDTACADVDCSAGACCDGTSCTELVEQACLDAGGSFEGAGTGCEPNPCAPAEGACCSADGSCTLSSEATCDASGGSYQGDGMICDPNPCPEVVGACCDTTDQRCTLESRGTCDASPTHAFQGGGTGCDPNPCTATLGACCVPDGSCYVNTEAGCLALGHAYQGDGTDCDPNPCPQPQGACCGVDGSCRIETQADCVAAGDAYQGDGTGCDPNPCTAPTGACCAPDGSCYINTQAGCLALGHAYQGDGTDCDPNPCPQPQGACCGVDGSCRIETQADCVAAGDAYEGDGTDCDPNPCPVRQGACCGADGSCRIETQAGCVAAGDAYEGDGTTCSPNPCPDPNQFTPPHTPADLVPTWDSGVPGSRVIYVAPGTFGYFGYWNPDTGDSAEYSSPMGLIDGVLSPDNRLFIFYTSGGVSMVELDPVTLDSQGMTLGIYGAVGGAFGNGTSPLWDRWIVSLASNVEVVRDYDFSTDSGSSTNLYSVTDAEIRFVYWVPGSQVAGLADTTNLNLHAMSNSGTLLYTWPTTYPVFRGSGSGDILAVSTNAGLYGGSATDSNVQVYDTVGGTLLVTATDPGGTNDFRGLEVYSDGTTVQVVAGAGNGYLYVAVDLATGNHCTVFTSMPDPVLDVVIVPGLDAAVLSSGGILHRVDLSGIRCTP